MTGSDVLQRPVVVVGAPRSGTTILGQLLEAHPVVAFAREPRLVWKTGNDRRSDLLSPDDARPEVVTAIRRWFTTFVTERGGSRLVEKTPSNALRLGFVERVLPDMVVIHITRDGRSAVPAIRERWSTHAKGVRTTNERQRLLRRARELRDPRRALAYGREIARRLGPAALTGPAPWGPRLPGMDGMLAEMAVLEVAALQWTWSVQLARAFGEMMPEGRYVELRLEDLDEHALRHVLDVAGLSAADEVLATYRDRFQVARTGATRSLEPDERALLDRWIAPTQQLLGYQ